MPGVYHLIGAFILGLSIPLTAQTSLDRAAIEEMFDEMQKIDWYSTFTGTIDDVHPARMALACAGQECRGRYVLPASGTVFDLRGILDNGRASLEEIDHTGRVSGYLDVHLTRDICTGEWWSRTHNRAVPVHFVSSRIIQLKTFVPEMLLIDGTAAGRPAQLILTKETPEVVSATITLGDELLRGVGTCDDRPCATMTCPVSGDADAYATLKIQMPAPGKCTFSITSDDRGPQLGSGTIARQFPVTQTTLSGYDFLIDCTYPTTGHAAFDAWVHQQFTTWTEAMRPEEQRPVEELRPADRWSHRGYAWIDLYVFNDVVASGTITQFSIRDSVYQRMPFIYDLANHGLLDTDELAKKDVDLHTAILSQADHAKDGATPAADNAGILPLKYVSMGTGGFIVQSDFDQVYGDRAILIPYRSVEQLMRRNALTNSVLQ